jgi:hypothetical protein
MVAPLFASDRSLGAITLDPSQYGIYEAGVANLPK